MRRSGGRGGMGACAGVDEDKDAGDNGDGAGAEEGESSNTASPSSAFLT